MSHFLKSRIKPLETLKLCKGNEKIRKVNSFRIQICDKMLKNVFFT